jgi:hypothetical protein
MWFVWSGGSTQRAHASVLPVTDLDSVRSLTVKGGKVTDLRQMSLDRERVGVP